MKSTHRKAARAKRQRVHAVSTYGLLDTLFANPDAPMPEFTGQAVWRYNFPRPAELDALHAYNGPIGVGNLLKKRRLAGKIALVGTTIPSQAKALIMAGVIREGFLWSPKEAGLAMTSVARLALDGAKFESGMEIPGLGKANIDSANNVVMVDRILSINKNTIDALIKLGL